MQTTPSLQQWGILGNALKCDPAN